MSRRRERLKRRFQTRSEAEERFWARFAPESLSEPTEGEGPGEDLAEQPGGFPGLLAGLRRMAEILGRLDIRGTFLRRGGAR